MMVENDHQKYSTDGFLKNCYIFGENGPSPTFNTDFSELFHRQFFSRQKIHILTSLEKIWIIRSSKVEKIEKSGLPP